MNAIEFIKQCHFFKTSYNGLDRFILYTIMQVPFVDVHILRYPVGSKNEDHKDTIHAKNHYRLNVVLRNAKKGGMFYILDNKKCVFIKKMFYYFRPDLIEHGVTEIQEGERWVLTFGFARRRK